MTRSMSCCCCCSFIQVAAAVAILVIAASDVLEAASLPPAPGVPAATAATTTMTFAARTRTESPPKTRTADGDVWIWPTFPEADDDHAAVVSVATTTTTTMEKLQYLTQQTEGALIGDRERVPDSSTPTPTTRTTSTTSTPAHTSPGQQGGVAVDRDKAEQQQQHQHHHHQVAESDQAAKKRCAILWQQTIGDPPQDFAPLLAQYGGHAGLLDGDLTWQRNATEQRPARWTYFWGKSDFKTFIRVERGEVDSETQPGRGATPDALTGDLWWSPVSSCSFLQHIKYKTLEGHAVAAMAERRSVAADATTELCNVVDSAEGALLRCNDAWDKTGGPGALLIATLVG